VEGLEELWLTLLSLAALALPGGLVCATLWWLLPRSRRRLFFPQRVRAVPWRGMDVFFAFGVQLILPALMLGVLESTGFFRRLYGHDVPPEDARASLWAMVLALPLMILTILGELFVSRDARPYQLGLTTRHAGSNVIAGYLGWLLLTPVVLVLFTIITQWTTPEEHALLRVVKEQPIPWDWFLVTFSAAIAAPILEELVFRGVLLPWLIRASAACQVMVAWAAVLAACLLSSEKSLAGWKPAPVLFVVAMLPGYWFAPRIVRLLCALIRRPPPDRLATVTRAIYGTSLIFAAFHSSVWPSPIPLFILALGLGCLAYRTQSLIGPLVLHSLFNAVSCIVLVLGA